MAKTYNTIGLVSAGDPLTETIWNEQAENVNNYRVPPMAVVARTSNQTGYTSQANISWSSALVDTESPGDPMWAAGSPGVVTIRTAGLYLVQLQFHASASATVTFAGCLIKKGSTVIGEQFLPIFSPGGFPEMKGNMALVVDLAAADTVSGGVTIVGGSSYTIRGAATTTDSQTRLAVTWIGQQS